MLQFIMMLLYWYIIQRRNGCAGKNVPYNWCRDVIINRLWVQHYSRRRGMKTVDCLVIYTFERCLTVWLLSYSPAAFTTVGYIPGSHYFWRLSRSQSHSASERINPLNPELNPICYLLALLGAHHFLHVSRIRVKLLTFRLLMSYIYGAPILDVSRSHKTTQHSR